MAMRFATPSRIAISAVFDLMQGFVLVTDLG
jgi:hypothetical protein